MISTKDPNGSARQSASPLEQGGEDCVPRRSTAKAGGEGITACISALGFQPSPSLCKGEATHARHRVGALLKKEIEALEKSSR